MLSQVYITTISHIRCMYILQISGPGVNGVRGVQGWDEAVGGAWLCVVHNVLRKGLGFAGFGGGAQEKGYLRANTPDRGGATTKRELRPHRTCTRNFRAARHLQKKLVLGKDRRVGWEMPIPGDRKCGPELKNRNFSEYSYT